MTQDAPNTVLGPIPLWLTVFGDTGPVETIGVAGPRFVIGRDDTCDLVLDDPKVSRFHAEIVQASGPFRVIRDLDSANGTLVNGKRIAPPLGFSPGAGKIAELSGGEWLFIGETKILASLSDPRASPAAES